MSIGQAAAERAPKSTAPVSFLTDLLTTSAAQAATVLLNAASLAVISRRLGELDLGLYTLERRGVALLQPLVLLGISVATPRYIALSLDAEEQRARGYAAAGTLLVIVVAGAVGALIALFPAPVAAVVFGDSAAVGLARALGGFAFATAAFQITYSVARGHLHMARANLLELTVVGALPLVVAAFGPTDIVALMWVLTGGIVAATVVVALGELSPRADWRSLIAGAGGRAGGLLRFGLARTPGDIAVVALFAVAPIAVVHSSGPVDAGHTSVVLSSLNLVSAAAVPLGVILLPRVALHAARPEGIPFTRYVLLAGATLDLGLVLGGMLFVASPLVAELWLPDAPGSLVTALEVASLGLPGYVFYLVFRSYLDAVDRRPLSSVATVSALLLLAAVLTTLLVADVWPAPVAAAAAVSISLTAAGAVTWGLAGKRIPGFVGLRTAVVPGAVLLAAVALGIGLREAAIPVVLTATAAAAVASGLALAAARRPWLLELRKRVVRRRIGS